MARASYIYLVYSNSDESIEPKAVFTVKHEAISWIKKQVNIYGEDESSSLYLIRTRDGMFYNPTEVDIG